MKKLLKRITMTLCSLIVVIGFIGTTTSKVDAANKTYINKVYDLKWKTSFSGDNYYEFYFSFINKGKLSIEVSKSSMGSSISSLYPNTIKIYDKNGNCLYKEDIRNGKNKFDEYKVLEFNIPSPGEYYVRINAGVSWRPVFSDGETYWNQTVKFIYPNDNNTSNDANVDWVGHWAESTISEFISKGYINGYSDGTFRPNNSITRAEFVTIVNNYFRLTKSSGKVFNDTKSHWAKSAIDIAVTNGVCNGISSTEFKPNDPITREQASVMISNYKKLSDKNHDKINKYKDKNQVSLWAKDGVEGMIEKGYMSGYSDNTFKPKNHITRAEAVVTLSRVK